MEGTATAEHELEQTPAAGNGGVPDSPAPEPEAPVDPDPAGEPAPGDGDGGEPPAEPADLPEGDEPDEPAEEPAGLMVEGDRQLTLTIGGAKPTSSVLKLIGGKLDLEGAFHKGDTLRVALDLRVGEVSIADTMDEKTGSVKATKRTHKARIVGVHRLSEA